MLSSALWKRVADLRKTVQVVHNVSAVSFDMPSRRRKPHASPGYKTAGIAEEATADKVEEIRVDDCVTIELSDGRTVQTSLLVS